jgi:hypothetical protein
MKLEWIKKNKEIRTMGIPAVNRFKNLAKKWQKN